MSWHRPRAALVAILSLESQMSPSERAPPFAAFSLVVVPPVPVFLSGKVCTVLQANRTWFRANACIWQLAGKTGARLGAYTDIGAMVFIASARDA